MITKILLSANGLIKQTPIFLIPIVTTKHVKLVISILGVVKTGKHLACRSIFLKVYEEEMLIRTLAPTLLELFFLNSRFTPVTFKRM